MQQLQLEQQLAREQNVDEGSMMGDFVRKVPVIGKTESCHDVLNLFLRDSRIPCVILCDDKNMPHGLIMRDRFYTQMMVDSLSIYFIAGQPIVMQIALL
ncbi:hypothetical protein [Paenibacillus sp. JCM 10914]|uniref:hypothetical protein n=1 Tax=Paenibacillus sp. JCM 10914 TaxID=1236974 RepID=UPI0003CC4CF0|nr:hypothetical protein [Paenibacillus sp. JCM 10914]GAE05891.1 hypothetical protein JCM10914_2021 [Paenibacillus sp. JCM 10914]